MLHSAPRGSLCAEAFRAIEADLEAFSPGRAAAHATATAGLRKASELFKHSCEHMTHATRHVVMWLMTRPYSPRSPVPLIERSSLALGYRYRWQFRPRRFPHTVAHARARNNVRQCCGTVVTARQCIDGFTYVSRT